MSRISVLILTLNEEANLGHCLESCAWCDDIVVLDSLSTDRTRDIARARGARVIERAFDNYAAQRTAGLTEIEYHHPWVLMLDADERTPAELITEMEQRVAEADAGVALFRMRRKDFFLGRWLRRSSGYPTWFGRLVRPGRVRIEREVNEEYLTDGKVGYLEAHLHHYPFNKGVAWWLERHNRYSSLESAALADESRRPLSARYLWSSDPIERRRALKALAYRLPLRPGLVFLYWYVVRFGWLDGRAGLTFSLMRAHYEFLINLKALEARRRRRGLPV